MDDYQLQGGDRIDDFTIRRPIGKGGFAQIYLAESPSRGEAALKLYTDPAFDYRNLFNEVMAMGLFSNRPYFVKLLGASDISSPYLYIAMEYLPGGTLQERLRRGVDLNAAMLVVHNIAQALRDMHEIGMIHRDISPDNIFVGDADQAKLGDLGLAARMDVEPEVAFKPHYTAPEALQGYGHTAASDIYSLGVCLFEMLGADPRRNRPSPDVIERLALPEHIALLIDKMCHSDPEQRWGAPEVIRHIAMQGFPGSPAAGRTYVAVNAGDNRERGLVYLERLIRERRRSMQQEREEYFLRTWEGLKEELFEGLGPDLKESFSKAVYFSLTVTERKGSNCYLGLEHLLMVLLEEDHWLRGLLEDAGVETGAIRSRIFDSLRRISHFPSADILSPRLRKLVRKAKEQGAGDVGEHEFARSCLAQETLFSHVLKEFGVDSCSLIREAGGHEA